MTQTAFVTGADRGLGFALCLGLLQRGWRVCAGQYMPEWPDLANLTKEYPDALTLVPLDIGNDEAVRGAAQATAAVTGSLDLLINNAGVTAPSNFHDIREPQDYAAMQRILNINALGPIRMVEAFLPLLDAGTLKRLCFVSSEAGSVGASQRTGWFGYCMSKAALNMGVKNLHNQLYLAGYTFRLYHPGWLRSYMGGVKNSKADMEPEEAAARAIPIFLDSRADEARLVLVDYQNQEWPW